jgi:hypothetical protein
LSFMNICTHGEYPRKITYCAMVWLVNHTFAQIWGLRVTNEYS